MVFRDTGVGKVDVDDKLTTATTLKALLFNFHFDDMNDDRIKFQHQTFLDDRVIPMLRDGESHAWLQGSASKIGQSDYNMRLSQHRVDKVANYLVSKGVQRPQLQPRAQGSLMANQKVLDDEHDRSVTLLVMKAETPVPPVVPPRPKVSTTFRIRQNASISPSFKVAGMDAMIFQIWDTTNNLTVFYAYVGAGLNLPLPFTPPVSATLTGPWNDFTTSKAISSMDFTGDAEFRSIGAGPLTRNALKMSPPGITPILLSPFETGFTVGAGGSDTSGTLGILPIPKAGFPWPFSG